MKHVKDLHQALPSDPFGCFIRDLFGGENVTGYHLGYQKGHLEEAGRGVLYIYIYFAS